MLEFSSLDACSTDGNSSSPLVGFSSNDTSCDGNVALLNDFESSGGCSNQGAQGPEGFSAYQIAVFNGFVGTEEQWLASLQGEPGEGVPPGGIAGQILAKIDDTSYNTEWIDNPDLAGYVPYTGATQDVDLGEFGIKVGNIELDLTPTVAPTTVGSIVWNDTAGTADIKLKGGNVTLQVGQETVARVVNKTATNITLLESKYQVVRVTGAQGQRPKVDLAMANNDLNSTTTLGIVTENILNNQEGFITTSGQVQEINTTGSLQGETWVDGDVLYLSGTIAGQSTNIKPIAPIHTVILGFVEYAHAIHGKIFVKVDNGYELEELHNVSAIAPNNNEVLTYDTPTLLWKPKTISTILGYTPFNFPSLTSGSVLFSDGTTIAQDNANFFWNNTTKRLGINTPTPSYALHVSGVTGANTFTVPSYNSQLSANYLMLYGGYGAGMQGSYNNPTGGNLTFGPYINSIFNEKMRLLPSGNFGIGTTSPIFQLDVSRTGGTNEGKWARLGSIIAAGEGAGSYPSIGYNIESNSSGFKYIAGDFASWIKFSVGGMQFNTAASGTAGTAITAAATSMAILQNGNVGIGISSPVGKLDVIGSLVTARILTTGSLSLIGTDVTAGAQTILTLSTGVNNTTGPNIILSKARGQVNEGLSTSDILGTIQFQGANGTASLESSRIQSIAASGFSLTSRASHLTFYTTPIGSTTIAERMRINSEGNVGIGTIAPTAKLQITQGISSFPVLGTPASSALFLAGDSNLYGIYLGLDSSSGKAYLQAMRNDSAVSYSFILNPVGGNVGIGTISPGGTFDVAGALSNNKSFIRVTNTDTANYITIGAGIPSISNAGMNFTLDGSSKMVISAGGNIGIGTTSPGQLLDINAGAASTAIMRFTAGNNVNVAQLGFVAGYGAVVGATSGNSMFVHGTSIRFTSHDLLTEWMRILNNGNVGIGTATPNTKAEIYRLETVNRTSYSDIVTISAAANTNPYTGHGGGILFRATNYISGTGLVDSARIGSTITNNSVILTGADLFFDVSPLQDGILSRAMTIKYNGAIGMGTITPTARLQVKGDGTNSTARFENSFGNTQVAISLAGQLSFGSAGANEPYLVNYNGTSTESGTGQSLRIRQRANTGSTGNTLIQYWADGLFNNTASGTAISHEFLSSGIAGAAGNTNYRNTSFSYIINNSGAQTGTATGIYLNATETALNGMAHNLIDLQVGGVSKASITNNGQLIIDRSFGIKFQLSSVISAPSNGTLVFQSASGTDFNRIMLGGTTVGFPSIKRNGAGIDFRLADDSNYCKVITGDLQTASGTVFESLGNTINLRSQLGGGSGHILDIQSRSILNGTNVEQGAVVINITKANSTVGTANFKPISLLYTINNTAAQTGTATGIFLNATETALNGMGHNLMDLQVSAVSKFRVQSNAAPTRIDINGLNCANTIAATDFTSGTYGYVITGVGKIAGQSNGVLTLLDTAFTSFNRLQFGGTTNLFPAIKRNGTVIEFKLADDSGFCAIGTNKIFMAGQEAITEGSGMWYSSSHPTRYSSFTIGSGQTTITAMGARLHVSGSWTFADTVEVPSAIVAVTSTTKGFLPPRMTTGQKNAIVSPATGLIVFDTDLGKLCVFAVTWQTITSA